MLTLSNLTNMIAALALSAGIVAPSMALAVEKDIPQEEIEKFLLETRDIKTQALPMGRVMVSQKDGVTTILSDNGRFRFEGSIVDTWAQIEIKSHEDAVFSAEHLPMDRIGLEPEMLAPLYYGDNDDQNVLVFLSPDDPASRAFLDELPSMKEEFKFDLVVVPSSTTPMSMATAFSCVDDRSDALNKLMTGKGMLKLKPAEGCDLQILNNRMIAFNLLGFYDLPTVISPATKLGVSQVDGGWKKFLMENMK
ncbi:MAG: hypothetical protein GX771_05270 [Halomonadaceae bacterium]|nr:hypothetical protein [Halomonadaceae bacterium]